MTRPPAPRSLLVEHAALPRPFEPSAPAPPAVELDALDRVGRVRVAAQLVALAALLAEFELWLPRWALRRARVVECGEGLRASVPALPVPISRLWSSLGGGERAADRARAAVLTTVADLAALEPELVAPRGREPGFAFDGVIERLLDELPLPLDAGTAEALWMLRWSQLPHPERGDTALYALDEPSLALRVASAAWVAEVRRGGGATLVLARGGNQPTRIAEHPGEPSLAVVCGEFDEGWLSRVVERNVEGAGATLAVGRFPDGWRPPPAPVFDRERLTGHLALVGTSPARRLQWLEGHGRGFGGCSRGDRQRLTRSAAGRFAADGPRPRGRFSELARVAGLLPEGVPVELLLELAGCSAEWLAEAEAGEAVLVRDGRALPARPVELRVDPLHREVLELVAGDPAREALHGALSTGDTGELLSWARRLLDDLDAQEVRQLLGALVPGTLGPGVQVALAEACLSLADIHGARRALSTVPPEAAGPWRAWLELLDRPPDSAVVVPGEVELRQAPRAAAELALVALRRSLPNGGDPAAGAEAAVRSALELLRGASRRWIEIRLVALLDPARLDDPEWRRRVVGGHPQLEGLVLFERSVRATLDGRPRLARRLLERVVAAERSPGRLALMVVNLGALAFDEGRSPEAEALTLRAFRFFQAAGFRHRTWEVLHNLAVADIDQLRVARAAARLDQVAAGRDSRSVAVERARLELALGNLESFDRRLDELPGPDQAVDPQLVEALSFLHGARALLLGRTSAAIPLLCAGGPEAAAWLDLANALTGDPGPPAAAAGPEDGWGVRRAAALVRQHRAGKSASAVADARPETTSLSQALAAALVRYLGVVKGWSVPGEGVAVAEALARGGLTGWAATLRWSGRQVAELLGALSELVRGRGPDLWPESHRTAILELLGVGGLVARTPAGGDERWRLGSGSPLPGRVPGRLELVPLGREPLPGPGWGLVADLLELTAPADAVPGAADAEAAVRLDGCSEAIRELRDEVALLAGARFTILIHGETGSGKEVVAREIHRLSGRPGELVSVNVAAIPVNLLEAELFGSVRGAYTGADRSRRGLVVAADRGTLFLDEVGDLDSALQVKLLRFLESGEVRAVGSDRPATVDVRVICATHRNLDRLVRDGRFRQDLFYRIAVARVTVPPLRDRIEDLPRLVSIFSREACERHGLPAASWSPAAERVLRAHGWPGNVRELKHTVEVAMARSGGEVIGPEHLPIADSAPAPRGTWEHVLTSCKRRLLVEALGRHRGNRSAAARELGITRQALLYQLKALDLTDL